MSGFTLSVPVMMENEETPVRVEVYLGSGDRKAAASALRSVAEMIENEKSDASGLHVNYVEGWTAMYDGQGILECSEPPAPTMSI